MVATPITAPQVAPANHGLIASAFPSPDSGVSNRWENGFGFVPESCLQPESWVIPCVGVGSTAGPGATITDNRPTTSGYLEWAPYVIQVPFTCTLQQTQAIDFEDRARRIMEAGQSKLMETELYRGDASGYGQFLVNPARNPWNLTLTDLTSTGGQNLGTGGTTTPTLGIRSLIQAAADAPNGTKAMLHATPSVVEAWMQGNSVIQDSSGRLITRVGGHTVISGTGYTGQGINNAAADPAIHWAWVTSPVYYLLGEDITVETVAWRDNDATAIVRRTACAYWDGCLHAGVPIDPNGTVI